MPNSFKSEKKLFVDGQTYGHTGGRTLRPALLGGPGAKKISAEEDPSTVRPFGMIRM